LLLSPSVAFDGVRSYLHWTSVHLLLTISSLETPSHFMARKFAPSFSLAKPLGAVLGVSLGALEIHQFHSAAICEVAHWVLP
jgi:hypothetical protein